LYKILIETHFDAAHQLNGYVGQCGRLHGHTWKVHVEVLTHKINEIGISLDFKVLKAITEDVIKHFDHQDLNKVAPFDQINPTAENLSRYIYQEIEKQLPSAIQIKEVTIWESDKYAVSYSEGRSAKSK
jgi:6-pyruvoyltetrahydropterin/6-carboxytetrahydropterin synthase